MANMSLQAYVQTPVVKERFIEVLGKGANAFVSTILAVYNGNPQLQACDPRSIIGAAGYAATLKLQINPSLGQAYIVPRKGQAIFQIGWRGLVQLAHRTGKCVVIHSGVVYEGEIVGVDPLTGELICGERISDVIVGYVAFFRLTNGFSKAFYMTKTEIEEHAFKYSDSYRYDKSRGKNSSP